MTHEDKPLTIWNDELTDREAFFIGKIVANWGALENEIFLQTLVTFHDIAEGQDLPKEMNNLNFSKILDLWEKRVIGNSTKEVQSILSEQLGRIRNLGDYRNAIIHSMLDWDRAEISKLNAKRIRKKDIVTIQFSRDDLEDFYLTIAEINFHIRIPNGLEGLAGRNSSYVSRMGLAMMSDSDLDQDWIGLRDKLDEE